MKSRIFKSFRPVLVPPGAGFRWTCFRNKLTGLPLQRHLRLQAHIDGELTRRQALQTARLLADDSDAQSILMELSLVKSALVGNEIERPTAQNRELYWSSIERAITTQVAKQDLPSAARRMGLATGSRMRSGLRRLRGAIFEIPK